MKLQSPNYSLIHGLQNEGYSSRHENNMDLIEHLPPELRTCKCLKTLSCSHPDVVELILSARNWWEYSVADTMKPKQEKDFSVSSAFGDMGWPIEKWWLDFFGFYWPMKLKMGEPAYSCQVFILLHRIYIKKISKKAKPIVYHDHFPEDHLSPGGPREWGIWLDIKVIRYWGWEILCKPTWPNFC